LFSGKITIAQLTYIGKLHSYVPQVLTLGDLNSVHRECLYMLKHLPFRLINHTYY